VTTRPVLDGRWRTPVDSDQRYMRYRRRLCACRSAFGTKRPTIVADQTRTMRYTRWSTSQLGPLPTYRLRSRVPLALRWRMRGQAPLAVLQAECHGAADSGKALTVPPGKGRIRFDLIPDVTLRKVDQPEHISPRHHESVRRRKGAALDGLLWIENQLPFTLTARAKSKCTMADAASALASS
jgi:hypothetical protein